MNLEFIKVSSPTKDKSGIVYSGMNRSKEASPMFFSEFSRWDDDNPHNLSVLPLVSVKSPQSLKKPEGLKDIPRTHRKHKSTNSSNLPVVVSAYEISKYHPKFKEFFDQPLRTSRAQVKFPVINTKSVFSVYLNSMTKRRQYDTKVRLDKKDKTFEIYKIKDKNLTIK
ncbi:hypothetical protein SteCoe_26723 [Stentor coeruleus]|uniref:Uncharacterized protein n=1 Tax=Stentor coeruleus TaxID=5963 RepID=A0A1R2BC72_9CILI|nr:hypothetical protein SteCoe_26723 [Stentor coeruleus]